MHIIYSFNLCLVQRRYWKHASRKSGGVLNNLNFWRKDATTATVVPSAVTSKGTTKKESLSEVEDKQKIKILADAAKKSSTHIDKASVLKSAPSKRRRIQLRLNVHMCLIVALLHPVITTVRCVMSVSKACNDNLHACNNACNNARNNAVMTISCIVITPVITPSLHRNYKTSSCNDNINDL